MRTLASEQLDAIAGAVHATPFDVLGPHPVGDTDEAGVIVRAFLPEAQEATVVEIGGKEARYPMSRAHPAGVFEVVCRGRTVFPYEFAVVTHAGQEITERDPYAFPFLLTDFDLHLLGEGQHYQSYTRLGARPCALQGVAGVHFAVWAPNAQRVSVVGDFNGWDERRHPMQVRGGMGIWELFIPDLAPGAIYKYAILSRNGHYRVQKADPYAFASEVRPRTASVVYDLSRYQWQDEAWIGGRVQRNALDAPIAIYEVHLGSWRRVPEEGNRPLTYREAAPQLADYLHEMGYTHVEFLPLAEHPFDGSWGYQVTGYYAPTSRFGTPDDFRYLVDYLHQRGIGVILDWVPAHFPSDEHGLVYFDGTHLYEHADPRRGVYSEWGTLAFNFGRNEVRNFLLSNALFWLNEYHIDGLRVDAVAAMLYLDYSRKPGEWVPNRYGGRENLEAIDFIRRFNELAHGQHPGILTIAEESTSWPMVARPTYVGGLGFSLKWNMGWMHDMLHYMSSDPIYRRWHHNDITFSLLYAFSENFILPFSHDEVVYGKRSMLSKMPGDSWQQFANLRALYGYMYGHPGKKLLFMGSEFGQRSEWNHDTSLDWNLLDADWHNRLRFYVRDLNRLYRTEPALYEVDFNPAGFEWIDCNDNANSVISFIRRAHDPEDALVFVVNFTPVPRYGYRVGMPAPGVYHEVLNSDHPTYAGSGVSNGGDLETEAIPWQGRSSSIVLTLPPLATIILKRDSYANS
jgi:1,4-alpha-glucan branching enzyme